MNTIQEGKLQISSTESVVELNKEGNINSLEDRLWALANLISAEEHAFSSWLRTNDMVWYMKLIELRDIRRDVMISVLGADAQHNDAEIWCTFKHLLASAMRLYEAGCRYMKDDSKRAKALFENSHTLIIMALSFVNDITQEAPENIKHEERKPPVFSVCEDNAEDCSRKEKQNIKTKDKETLKTEASKSESGHDKVKWTFRLKEILKCCIE